MHSSLRADFLLCLKYKRNIPYITHVSPRHLHLFISFSVRRPPIPGSHPDRVTMHTCLRSERTIGVPTVFREPCLTLGYATTFNSCQGLNIDRVGVDLTYPVFSHGQLYTALSHIPD